MSSGTELLTRNPDTFDTARLVVKDFDGTVAKTFEKSPPSEGYPEGIGVEEAHQITIESMFGTRALQRFIDEGGLRNRAALEVVQDFAPDAGDELGKLVESFIDEKLDVLLGEIGRRFPDGTVWPRPTPGYFELRERMSNAQDEGILADDLILSSGHEPFISKTYSVWEVGVPRHILAEDTVKRMGLPFPSRELIKPSPRLMVLAGNIWRADFGLAETSILEAEDSDRMVYIGDDDNKDGQLARASGVDFFLLRSGNERQAWNTVSIWLGLGELTTRGVSYGQ